MSTASSALRLVLVLGVTLLAACGSARARVPEHGPGLPQGSTALSHPSDEAEGSEALDGAPGEAGALAEAAVGAGVRPVSLQQLSSGRLRLVFPAPGHRPEMERLGAEEIRPLLSALGAFRPEVRPRLRLMLESPGATGPRRGAAPWEVRLREDFLSRYGPALLPLPESLEESRLSRALQLSTRHMGEGFRDAARELFESTAFRASVALSVLVYFAAWLAPEPLFSKAFAAALTVRLALLVGVAELGQVALACLRLYQESEAATTPEALEAAAARFGRALGGTGLRVVVLVASLGVPQVLPQVPRGGVWTLLSPLRHSPAAGPALESVATAQVVADGSLVVTGVAAGTLPASLCGELAHCSVMSGSGGGPRLSTRYGKPHTRQNPPHNEVIEQELARREAAGHTELRKNLRQVNSKTQPVLDRNPVKGIRFRRPDASSVRPDGIRHNTNYVSNARDLKRELEALESLVRSDPRAIHELYMLDGTLLRRYVPPGVSFP